MTARPRFSFALGLLLAAAGGEFGMMLLLLGAAAVAPGVRRLRSSARARLLRRFRDRV